MTAAQPSPLSPLEAVFASSARVWTRDQMLESDDVHGIARSIGRCSAFPAWVYRLCVSACQVGVTGEFSLDEEY